MKDVLLVAPQPFYTLRGTPINIRAVASTLAEAGYRVTLLTLPFGEDIALEGVTIRRIRRLPFTHGVPIGASLTKLLYLFSFAGAVLLETKRRRYDLLHGIEEGAFAVGLTSMVRSIPYIVDVDSCMPTQLRESWCGKIPGLVSLFSGIENFFLKRSQGVITVCSALTRKVQRAHPEARVFQIEDFPFPDALHVDPAKLTELRHRFPRDGGRRLVLYTGNLESYQGVDLLIRSFAASRNSNTHLIIVGGPQERVAPLKTIALEHGVADRVFFEGARPSSEMGAYMALSDILASPRLSGENVPLKLYTYLASGKPLVATRIESHTQIVSDDTAFLGSVSNFSEALERALSASDTELSHIASRAQRLVEEQYSEQAFQERLIGAYQELLPLPQQEIPSRAYASL